LQKKTTQKVLFGEILLSGQLVMNENIHQAGRFL
jgi:hypothetical protein